MATLKGAHLKYIRYDSKTKYRIDKYIERESWSVIDWDGWIAKKLADKLFSAKKYVPYYQNYWRKNKLPFEKLENWPIITKEEINSYPKGHFIDERYSFRHLYCDHTSGTTGTPLNIYLDYDTIKEQYALFESRVKIKYEINYGDSWAIIGSQRVTPFNRKKPPYWVYNFSSRQLYLSSLHIANWTIQDYFVALKKYQPRYIIGYTNLIYELAKGMKENNLYFKMKAVITNAEPVYQYQKAIISDVFMCPVVDTYGQAELVSFASRFPDGKMYESPEMGIKEVIDIKKYEEEEYGKLIATSILNQSMPLIRYSTNDLISNYGSRQDGALPIYGNVLGRKDDVIKLEDGRRIVQIDGVFAQESNILQGQILQKSYTEFVINIVPSKRWNEQDASRLKKKLFMRLGDVKIDINICDKMELTWAGKFRVIQSEVS